MSEKERSQQRANHFAEIVSEVVNPVVAQEERTHEWEFIARDADDDYDDVAWSLHNGSREIIEQYAATKSTGADAMYVLEKPHKFLDGVAEFIENMDVATSEKEYMTRKFGYWHCMECDAEAYSIESGDEEPCE